MAAGKRKRGRVLTVSGRNKLNEAIEAWKRKNKQNATNGSIAGEVPHGMGSETVSKIRQGRPTDLSKIKDLFASLNLDLKDDDYAYPDPGSARETEPTEPAGEIEFPQGQVALNSPLYIERPPIEQRCYETVMRPGSPIRIKAPKQMGKTSLMSRILDRASEKGFQIATVDFQIIDKAVLTDLDRFLKWFCAYVGRQLKLENKIEDYWDPIFGSKVNCYDYFEKNILAKTDTPLALGLDEVDRIFEYRDIAEDFLGLLRSWHEEAKRNQTWQKLRLILTYSTEMYIPLDINQSPFNVGLPVELPEFDRRQVQDLAERHRLNLSGDRIEQLMDMVGGHPYLVRVALYHLADNNTDLDALLKNAPTEAGAYSDRLRRHLSNLEANPDLAAAMKQVVDSESIPLKPTVAYKLNSMGLTKQQEGDRVRVRCRLYREYFRSHL